uniref:Uncharacterized protein n=1 Tax=Anopheles minimus TaxID=112268 RepID=A0A182VPQ7_9DIPT
MTTPALTSTSAGLRTSTSSLSTSTSAVPSTTSALFTTRISTPPTPWNISTTIEVPSPTATDNPIPTSDPTTLPIVNLPNPTVAVWIALSGVFIVLFIIASAVALYIYVSDMIKM